MSFLMFHLRGSRGPELVTLPVLTMPRHRCPIGFIITVALVSVVSAFIAPHSFHHDITSSCQTLRMIAQDESPSRCREVSLVLASELCPSFILDVTWIVSLVRAGVLRKGEQFQRTTTSVDVEQRKATLEGSIIFHSHGTLPKILYQIS